MGLWEETPMHTQGKHAKLQRTVYGPEKLDPKSSRKLETKLVPKTRVAQVPNFFLFVWEKLQTWRNGR